MFIIQQRKSSICQTVLLIVLLEFTFFEKSTSNQRICGNRDTRNIFYFEVSNEGVNWTEAWRLCNNNSSTLPVICDEQEQDALTKYLRPNRGRISAVWTSGRMIKFDEWTWLDGQRFNSSTRGSVGVKPGPNDDYNHGALDHERTYKAENPSNKVYYLCQYSDSSCNDKNDVRARNSCLSIRKGIGDDRPWHDARNQCLGNGGDLAILNDDDLATLMRSDKLNDANSYWTGLRKNAWHWILQATDEDVKYSNWLNDPHSLNGECISIDASNGGWKAVSCTDKRKIVCQASSVETTSSTSSAMTTSRPASSSKSSSTTSRPSMLRTSWSSSTTSTMSITLLSTTTNAMSRMSESATLSTTNVDSQVPLYSGVGAGIAIIIICIIIILALRCRRKPQKDINGSNVKNNSEQNRLDLSPNKPATSPANAPANVPLAGADDSRGVYAEISLATLHQRKDEAKTEQPGIVYAALEFQKEPTYLEPDKKRAHTTEATKVAPMGDIIYAIPDAKSHAVASPGNGSASHPTKVTPQGDVYALPVKNSKSPNANPSHGGIYENL